MRKAKSTERGEKSSTNYAIYAIIPLSLQTFARFGRQSSSFITPFAAVRLTNGLPTPAGLVPVILKKCGNG
jgi:hypothetical protein